MSTSTCCRHDKALEALTLLGEQDTVGRFDVLIDALRLENTDSRKKSALQVGILSIYSICAFVFVLPEFHHYFFLSRARCLFLSCVLLSSGRIGSLC